MIPGAIFIAFKAASIRIVPLPHIGSTTKWLPLTLDKSAIAAARVSFIGASFDSARYPRLWSPAPEVSSITLTLSFIIRNWIWCSGPLSSSQGSIYFSESLVTTAFLIIFWQSGTLISFELRHLPFTGKASLTPIKSSQATDLTPSNSSSKLTASNSASKIWILSAYLELIFAFAISEKSPSKVTFPLWASTFFKPKNLNSFAHSPSRPKIQGAENLSTEFTPYSLKKGIGITDTLISIFNLY